MRIRAAAAVVPSLLVLTFTSSVAVAQVGLSNDAGSLAPPGRGLADNPETSANRAANDLDGTFQSAANGVQSVPVDTGGFVRRSEFNAAFQELRRQIQNANIDIDVLKRVTADHTARLGELRRGFDVDFGRLRDNVDAAIADQKKILEAVSRQDSDGNYLPQIAGNMSNTEFANEMRSVVSDSLAKEGSLSITNRTASDQYITINERDRLLIRRGEERKIERIPVGTVTTRLPDQRLVTWSISPPRYHQAIEIVQRTPSPPVRIIEEWPMKVEYTETQWPFPPPPYTIIYR